MKKLVTAGAFVAFAQVGYAQEAPIEDGFHTSGEVLFTYGNTHYGPSDLLGLGRLNFSGATTMGSVRATVRGEAILRSDVQDLPPDMDDPLNVEVALETGLGTVGYSTFHRCGGVGFPWTDGDVGNLGSANIYPWWPTTTFRCAGGISVYDGVGLGADDHFFYRNQIGGLSIKAWYDPDLNYENIDRRGVATVDGEEAPRYEGELAYDAGFARVLVGANDVGDYKFGVSAPVRDTGVSVSYEYDHYDSEALAMNGQTFTAIYVPQNAGIFRSVRADFYHVKDENGGIYDTFTVDTRFGRDNWELGVAIESQGNIAIEGSYKLRDNLSIVAGWDNGFHDGDGWSAKYGPPVTAPGRGDSYEIGVKMTF